MIQALHYRLNSYYRLNGPLIVLPIKILPVNFLQSPRKKILVVFDEQPKSILWQRKAATLEYATWLKNKQLFG